MKIISIIELKKHVADVSIFDIIIGKLNYWYKPCLIILFKIDKNLKINFYYTIQLLCLAIYL